MNNVCCFVSLVVLMGVVGCASRGSSPYFHIVSSLETNKCDSTSMPVVVSDKAISMKYNNDNGEYTVVHEVCISTPIGRKSSSYMTQTTNDKDPLESDPERQSRIVQKLVDSFSQADYTVYVASQYDDGRVSMSQGKEMLKVFQVPACIGDEERIVKKMLETDDVAVWNEGVELVSDDRLLADVAIAAHAFGEYDGKVKNSVLPAGLRAVEKLNKKAYIEKVYERALSNKVREAAKSKR